MRARRAELLGEPRRKAARRDAPRLGATDHAIHPAAEFEADFWQLRGFAGAGFATQNHDLMLCNQSGDFGAAFRNRQRIVEVRMGNCRVPQRACSEAFTRHHECIGQLFVELFERFLLPPKFLALFCQRNEATAIGHDNAVEIQRCVNRCGHGARILRARFGFVAVMRQERPGKLVLTRMRLPPPECTYTSAGKASSLFIA